MAAWRVNLCLAQHGQAVILSTATQSMRERQKDCDISLPPSLTLKEDELDHKHVRSGPKCFQKSPRKTQQERQNECSKLQAMRCVHPHVHI